MKKLFALFLVAAMCFSLVACGGDTTGNTNKSENEGTVITVENWENYLEFVVETDESEGFLNYRVCLKAKEGTIISNESNTMVHFSYALSKQHYTKEDAKIVLGECEAIEGTYTASYAMPSNQSEANYSNQIDNIKGSEWSFEDGNRWTNIPGNFVITGIEGSIIAE